MTSLTSSRPRLTRARAHVPVFASVVGAPRQTLRFFMSRRAPRLPKVVAALAVAYVALPLDLIPDFAPAIGWLDDAGVAGVAFAYVMKKVSDFSETAERSVKPPP